MRPGPAARILPQSPRARRRHACARSARRHIHQVTNTERPAVSLHVYAPSLVEMNEYEARDCLLYRINPSWLG